VQVVRYARHQNKLRTGHLRGNRFSILVRDVDHTAFERARRRAESICGWGFPNYFGAQRFGRDGETLRLGLELLSGKRTAARLRSRNRFLLRLSLSAVQAELFNRVLGERIQDDLARQVLLGDVMQVVETGGLFLVDDRNAEQVRYAAGEIAVTGPIFGPKMKRSSGEPAERETRVLAAAGLSLAQFGRFAKLASGTRRPLLVRPRDFSLARELGGLRVRFELPSGAYATSLLRELMKCECAMGEERDPSL
jgi:tRNA pseudouridine13 synthase